MVKFIHMKKCVLKNVPFKSLENNIFELIEGLDEVTVFVINGDKTEEGKAFLYNSKDDHPHVNVQYSEFGQ